MKWPLITRKRHEAECERLEELLRRSLDPGLMGIEMQNGMVEIGLKGGMAQLMAAGFIEQFKATGSKNYLQVGFHSDAYGPFTVTLQRVYGKAPTEVLSECEGLLREAHGVLEEDYGDGVNNGYWPTIAPILKRIREWLAERPQPARIL